jgi:xanthosine utilization system XapX-like protein
VVYSLIGLYSPAPPVVALIGEQVIPVGRRVLTGSGLGAAWWQSDGTQHLL